MDYPETASTVAMRETIQGLNTFLDGADVAFVDDGQGAVDHRQRHMRRSSKLLPDDESPGSTALGASSEASGRTSSETGGGVSGSRMSLSWTWTSRPCSHGWPTRAWG